MVKVFFESRGTAELVAIFNSESAYVECVESLEAMARSKGMILTESIESEDLDDLGGASECMQALMPNGVDEFTESHYEISVAVERMAEIEGSTPWEVNEEQGAGGLRELARDWSIEFENQNIGVTWGEDKEFFDTMEEFLRSK